MRSRGIAAPAHSAAPGGNALLVLPGWNDNGKPQFDALKRHLAAAGWACARAGLPDAAWPAALRERATREDGLKQALRDFDTLRTAVRPRSIAALGFSYGGYMAALLASHRPVDRLVLRCPALYPDERWLTPKAALDKRKILGYRRRLHDAADNMALASCRAFKGDVLLIACERDEVVLPPVIESYASAFAAARSFEMRVIGGADHELSKSRWRRQYHELVVDWLGGSESPPRSAT